MRAGADSGFLAEQKKAEEPVEKDYD
jgi:hypothetical protein